MLSSPQVNLDGDDVERLAAFYGAVGFAETFRTPSQGDPIHVELVLGGLTLEIAPVASAAADHGRVLDAGATSLVEPQEWQDRLRVAWVADPEGNPVEIVQSLGREVG